MNNEQQVQQIAQIAHEIEERPPEINWDLNGLIHMVKQEPLVLLFLGTGIAIWWLVRQITGFKERLLIKDNIIHGMHEDLRAAHKGGHQISEATQYQIGVKDRRSKPRD